MNSMKINKVVSLPSALLVLALSLPASAGTLYRYINDKGYQEIGYAIPSHLVQNGYDVIDESGRLLRRVAPQLTEEQYQRRLEHQRKIEQCEKALDRVLRLYESLDDIDKAENLYVKKADESIRNHQANLEYAQTTLLDRQDAAAGHERRGEPVPPLLLENIQKADAQIDTLTRQIAEIEQDKKDKAKQFDLEREMFRVGECGADQVAVAPRKLDITRADSEF